MFKSNLNVYELSRAYFIIIFLNHESAETNLQNGKFDLSINASSRKTFEEIEQQYNCTPQTAPSISKPHTAQKYSSTTNISSNINLFTKHWC